MLQHISPDSRRLARVWSGMLAATLLLGVIPWRVVADPEQGDPLAGSPGLDQQIHIQAEGIPISNLLALVSKQTGVDVIARSDVADDKVIIFGPPRPLKAVLADLAALYNDNLSCHLAVQA